MQNISNFFSKFSIIDYLKLLIILPVVFFYLRNFSKQSWGFFTANPKQVILNAYKAESAGVDPTPVLRNIGSYSFGISRKGRYLYNQMFLTVQSVKSAKWQSFYPDSLNYYAASHPFAALNLKGNEKGLEKGKYVFVTTQRTEDTVINNRLKILKKQQYLLIELK